MALRDGSIAKRAAQAQMVTADTLLAPVGTRGRVWSIQCTSLTAAVCDWNLRNTSAAGTVLWNIRTPATANLSNTVLFPQGLAFTDGLFADETAGAGQLIVAWTVD